MKKKSLTKITDLNAQDVLGVLTKAEEFKKKFDLGVRKENLLDGKLVAMVFEKPSLRTKVSFEAATTYLGGTAVFLTSEQIIASGGHEKGRESIPDIARNLERFCDLIIARVYKHETILEIDEYVTKPVINALCDRHHPTQCLADMMAIRWHLPDWQKATVAYVGDGNNVAVSLMQICAMLGLNFKIAAPKGYEIPADDLKEAKALCRKSGSEIYTGNAPQEAVDGADVIYTDTFVSMGQEAEKAERLKVFEGYQVNSALLKCAKPKAIFMHCLPAHRGEEVTDEVMDSEQSIIFDQAECRMHVAKALLHHYLVNK